MASFNRVVLMGNVTRDIEVRFIPSGMAVCDIGLAINDKRKQPDGQYVEEVTFVDCTCWGKTAEVAGEYLSKGSPVLIEGRLKLDTWEKDGQKRSKLKVTCDRMALVGSKKPSQDDEYNEPDRRSPAPAEEPVPWDVDAAKDSAAAMAAEAAASVPGDDYIPF